MLSLNGEMLRLDNMKVEMSLELKDQDMSGQSSGTDTSEQGDKGKELTFSGRIPFSKVERLTRLYQFASAKTEQGNRAIYRVGNDTAKALKIREGKFTGRISARENETLMCWNVSFKIREHMSVAERKELREQEQTKPEQQQNTRHQAALEKANEAMQ